MHKNKYQKRRGLRPLTSAASATQQELIQGPIPKPSGSQLSNDLGRETARQLRENANPNTRFIDKPTPTKDTNLLRQAAERQQSMIRDAQQQAFGNRNVPQVKPGGRFAAPSLPTSSLVFKGGGVRFQPTMRGNLLTAVAGVAAELLLEPVADVISDYVIHPMIGAAIGKDIPKVEELRRLNELRIQNEEEVKAMDEDNERIYQQLLEDAAMPIKVGEAPDAPILPPPPSQSLVEVPEQMPRHIPRAHSQSARQVDPNREYKIRRAALGDNPTKEEVDAVVTYGLAQHRKNFPHLY
tara:strand:+ start:1049 stop:1936 length:888 start_codon:yes stop_codon:yes gene_type:complete